MLDIDPRQRPRLIEVIHNLTERITDLGLPVLRGGHA